MKQLILYYALLISLFAVPVNATVIINSDYYTSERFGLQSVGQQISLSFNDELIIKTDFESFLSDFSGTFFSPSKIYYGAGIQYKQLGIMHYCMHNLDDSSSNTYPVRNKIYFQW